MKQLLLLVFTLLTFTAQATNYYISATGDDSNDGITPSTAWLTITKVNSMFGSFFPGDNILFERNGTYYGSLIVSQSGLEGNPIVIGAYGTGDKPIITGFTGATDLTNIGGNLWESAAIVNGKNPNMVTIDNAPVEIGRYPNTGWLTFESSVANSSITDNQLTGTTNWTGAEVVIRKTHWILSRDVITDHSGSTISYSGMSGYNSTNGYGYFIQNSLEALDAQNEWYFNNPTGKITIYSTNQPSNVKVATIDTLLFIGEFDYITVKDIFFEGSNVASVCIGTLYNQSKSIIVKNCDFNFSGRDAIYASNDNYCSITNCTINNSYNNAILFENEGGYSRNAIITNNTINNTGLKPGMGCSFNLTHSAITVLGNNALIEYNTIDSTGYIPINYFYDNSQVKFNKVNYFCFVKDDGAGIYTWTGDAGTLKYVGRKVIGNIVMNGMGAGPGTSDGAALVHGIYLDNGTTDVLIDGNTVYNCSYGGIYIHNTQNSTVTNNLVYDCKVTQLLIVHDKSSPNLPNRDIVIKNNAFVGGSAIVPVVTITSNRNDIDSINLTNGAIDNNYICRPFDENFTIRATKVVNGALLTNDYTMATWKSAYPAYNANTHNSPITYPTYKLNNLLTPNLVNNPQFTSGITGYILNSLGSNALMAWDNTGKITGAGSIKITPAVASLGYTVLFSGGAGIGPVSSSKKYLLRVTTKGSGNGILRAYIRQANLPFTAVSIKQWSSFGTAIKVHEFLITAPTTEASATIAFDIQEASGITYLDDIQFYEVNATVLDNSDKIWFDYNAGNASRTVSLSKFYLGVDSIIQRQAITLQPFTSSVLLRDNQAPIANAGTDKLITLPINTINLTGGGTDVDGTVNSYVWAQISGPATGSIPTGGSAATAISGLVQGVYEYELTVMDDDGATGKDTVKVSVNVAPISNAGTDKLITLPINDVSLNGGGTDEDGTISSYTWTQVSGPAGGNIVNSDAAATIINNLTRGVYEYELTVTDDKGATGKDTLQVIVNQPPVANAGADKLITLPINNVSLTGSGADEDGNISIYNWVKISGPDAGTIATPGAGGTIINGMVRGVYEFELTVTDDKGATGKDRVKVIVNQPPAVNAGIDKLITLPTNTVSLGGSATDEDGDIIHYAWAKITGPAAGTIENGDEVTTIVSDLVKGVYEFELTVTDDKGATGKDRVKVIVNQPPVANAGTYKLITLPINGVSLAGTGADEDGDIVSYTWTKISGPDAGSITAPNTATASANGLARGIYQYQLIVTDDNGATGTAMVQVTVNVAPVANAGTSKLITLPVNSVSLTGSGTDEDGSISSYYWVKVSGPSAGNIATAGSPTTIVNNLGRGVYKYELTVMDNNGATAKDTIVVTVNQSPVSNAGLDKLITLPINTVSLTGSGTDADGSISGYTWAKIAGPPAGSITTPNAANTSIIGLEEGGYEFELSVTDNNGATGKDTIQVTVNTPPVANAGLDKLITLPTNTISLTGSGTDADGTISSYSWTKVSGPAAGNITTPNAANTFVANLVQGIYKYELTVTDNNGATGKDTVQVTVNAPPLANAGADKLITLPINTVAVTGSGTDVDGTITNYSWVKIAGPAAGNITTPNAASTSVNNLAQGIYQYELTVIDNNGAIGKDTVQVTVNAPPVANAGADKLITLPINTLSLTGSGGDADGTIINYAWVKISGPATGNITTPGAANTSLSNLVMGIYQYELTVTDNNGAIGKDTIQLTVNAPPVANAGADKLITLPINTVSITGSGTDADGSISSYAWSKISGPAAGNIATPNAANISVNNLVQGIYRYELTVADNNGATGKDTVQVTVNAPPVANAGADKLTTLPINTVALTGNGIDADGTITNYAWVKISGPAAGNVTTPNTASTSVNNLVQGIYRYELTVTDNNGATGKDTVQVIVNAPPVVNAGTDKLVTLPINTVSLTGSGTDADGTVTNYSWAKIAGPAAGNITTPNAANTSVANLVQGIYQYELTVTDNNGAIGKDTVQVTVNTPPVSNAGLDKLITLPINTVAFSGSGTDADGTIINYAWVKISGPAIGNITTPGAANTSLTNLVQGIYQYELTVTDNYGATGKDTVQITVNKPPVANAGIDKLISLPINTVSLTGSGSDADGTVNNYLWTKISGPATGNITTPNSASTSVNNLAQGIYQYELTVTDNNGAIGKDTVQVTVNAPPVANAGADKLISLPINTVSLTGIGIDADGTIANYSWAKISGPAAGNITTPNAASTSVANLVQGIYQYELTVTDNNGATGKDTVQVTVNVPPVVNAGADKLITLPINIVSLTGSGIDADGTISTYSWAKIVGPVTGNITTPNAASTSVNNLVQGIYQYELTVTDNYGATGKDTVQITVNKPPVANAGIDKLISLPINTVSLTGSGSDADGTVNNYLWTKISGPATGNITTPGAANTSLTNLVMGIYQYELTVTDNNGATGKDTVQVTVNVPPVANAGADKLITLPINIVSLTGSGIDADGTISTYSWAKIVGPVTGNITTPNAASTSVNNLVQGIYQYELTVTDNYGATGKDTVQITVNKPPVANAGIDKLISLPINTVSLTGSGSDADGTVNNYLWTKISGPATGNITTPNSANTSVNNLVQGIYQYELTVTDNNGAIGKDTIQVTVNTPPVANAGADKLITLPINTTSLTGIGSDADGTITSYSWSKIAGPAAGNITTPNAASTSVNNLVQGIYQYELTVTDNNGATGKDTVQVTVNAPPVANAGADKLITLPINTASLAGIGSDADGTITSYSWSKIAGPAAGSITTPAAANTAINNLIQGIFQYELTITDNRGATGKDTLQVIVNAPPVVNAGTDKLITLPINTVSLTGSSLDSDGVVTSYSWVKIAGPAAGTITTPNAINTVINSLTQGIYQYQLTVTDNRGATAKDTIQVIVNVAPVANAGTDKLITLPTNTTSLTGSGTDADGTITSYAWVKIAGPATGIIVTAGTATTTINSLIKGVYQYQLTVTDNWGATAKDTLQVIVNAAPVANAGTDKVITLPANSTSLTGSGTDIDGTITSYAWLKIVGPATGTIVTAGAATTVINSLVQGIYQYQLTVTDNSGATAKDTMQVTVNIASNLLPVANAGIDKVITLPINTLSLTGSGTDADGTISSYAWSKIAGPVAGTIATATTATTAVNSMVQGIYQFLLTVTDNRGGIGKDTVQVIVNAAPIANAGADKLITLPTNTTSLTGSGTDADGTITSYAWIKIAGPATGTIATAGAATTILNGLTQGIYQYQLTLTDNRGATAKDTVQVIVNAAPVANAGTDKVIILPTNTTTLTGSATDADGTITGYAWLKIAGPATGTIVTAGAASTVVNSLMQGVYQFQLTVTDNRGATAKDTVLVTVNVASNLAPVANAGTDKMMTMPTNTVSLTGSGTDADGTISGYGWSKIAGPAAGTIAAPTAATTAVNSLAQGTYQFLLTVTDNKGATGKDTVQVVINGLPIANAGIDKVITLPIATTTLTGSGTDADGTITNYVWLKIAGPATGTIAAPTAATTVLNSLSQGVYQYQLTVTDNRGATAKDTVRVTVNAAGNLAPVANAGTDKVITLPVNTVSLTGSGTDADGTISSYAWLKIAGPATGTIAAATAATTAVNGMVQGVYQFQLTVTDNKGTTGKDTIQVIVNAPPIANAGTDKIITLPITTTTLTGTASDADGTIASYTWLKIAGPAAGTIVSAGAATTTINSLAQGVYRFQLTVTDNRGATGKDTVQVTVNAAAFQFVLNKDPIKTISLPVKNSAFTFSYLHIKDTFFKYTWANKPEGILKFIPCRNKYPGQHNHLIRYCPGSI